VAHAHALGDGVAQALVGGGGGWGHPGAAGACAGAGGGQGVEFVGGEAQLPCLVLSPQPGSRS
jgi:hypothetical protein